MLLLRTALGAGKSMLLTLLSSLLRIVSIWQIDTIESRNSTWDSLNACYKPMNWLNLVYNQISRHSFLDPSGICGTEICGTGSKYCHFRVTSWRYA